MDNESRLSATKYIWVVFLLALLIVNANVIIQSDPLSFTNVIMTGVIAVAAMGGTSFVWAGQTENTGATSDEKLKRGDRVKRLIDLMDEDELYELRKRLASDYSETPEDYVMLGDDGELVRKVEH